MYILIRLIFWIIIVLFCLKRIKRTTSKKIFFVILLVTSCVLPYVLNLLPVENLFYKFNSIKSISSYMGIKDIIDEAENNSSVMLVNGKKNKLYSVDFILKDNDGYKICSNYRIENKAISVYKDYNIQLYHIRNTKDYYLFIIDATGNQNIYIEDNQRNVFTKNRKSYGASSHPVNINYYYCSIHDFNDHYKLYINGEEVPLNIN